MLSCMKSVNIKWFPPSVTQLPPSEKNLLWRYMKLHDKLEVVKLKLKTLACLSKFVTSSLSETN